MPYDAVSTQPAAPDAPERRKSGFLVTLVTLLVLGMLGAGLFFTAERFAGYELQQVRERRNHPRVESTRPVDGEHAMAPGAPIYIELFTPPPARASTRPPSTQQASASNDWTARASSGASRPASPPLRTAGASP